MEKINYLHITGKAAHFIAYMIMVIAICKFALFIFTGAILGWTTSLYILEDAGKLTPELSGVISYSMKWNSFYTFMACVSFIAYRYLRKDSGAYKQ